jgi:hypothetical protein
MSEPTPLFRVVRGRPSAEETAALTVVLVAARAARARAARAGADSTGTTGNWASHARALRARTAPGPNAWRRSALPG